MASRSWNKLGAAGLAGVLSGVTGSAGAAGFALTEQSVTGLGNAFAGGSASAEDPTTVYFNPAGLTRLQGTQATAAVHVIAPSAELSDSGSRTAFGTPLRGGSGGEAGETRAVPNFYYARDLTSTVKFGLGINAPFGLATQYDSDWIGRYHAIKSDLTTVNINPALAFKLNDVLSLGVGVSAQFADAELTNAVDFGAVCAGGEAAGALPAGTCAALDLSPQGADGSVKVEGDDWSAGVNLGLLYELSAETRVGFAYRSKIKHTVDGDATFVVPASAVALTQSGAFRNTGVHAHLELPDTASLSVYHRMTPKWAVMSDITWTGWSSFDELRVVFDNPAQPDSVQPERWDDTLRYSLGFTYYHDPKWTFRFGIAYDETPIPDAEHRTPRIPGNSRRWIALGGSYSPSDKLTLDVGYTHLFVDDISINSVEVATGHRLVGTYDSSVDILSAQLQWRFM